MALSVEDQIGSWVVGTCLDSLFLGLVMTQIVSYFNTFGRNDPRALRLYVCVGWLAWSVWRRRSACNALSWRKIVLHFDETDNAKAPTPLEIVMTGILGILAFTTVWSGQGYYLYRLYNLSNKNWWIVIAIASSAFISCVLCITACALYVGRGLTTAVNLYYSAYPIVIVADVSLSLSTTFYLLRFRHDASPDTANTVRSLVLFIFQTAAPGTFIIARYVADPWWESHDSGKVWAFSILWTLNARSTTRKRLRRSVLNSTHVLAVGDSRAVFSTIRFRTESGARPSRTATESDLNESMSTGQPTRLEEPSIFESDGVSDISSLACTVGGGPVARKGISEPGPKSFYILSETTRAWGPSCRGDWLSFPVGYMSTSIVSPSIPQTVGARLVGTTLDLLLLGLVSGQIAKYWARHRHRRRRLADPLVLRVYVAWLACLIWCKSSLNFALVWQVVIVHFGEAQDPSILLMVNDVERHLFGVLAILVITIVCTSQAYYIHRLYIISNKNRPLAITISVMSFTSYLLSVLSASLFMTPAIVTAHSEVELATKFLFAAYPLVIVCDLSLTLITAIFLFYFRRHVHPTTATVLTRLIVLIIQTAAPATIVTVINFVLTVTLPHFSQIPPSGVLSVGSIWAFSVMWSINARIDPGVQLPSTCHGGVSDIVALSSQPSLIDKGSPTHNLQVRRPKPRASKSTHSDATSCVFVGAKSNYLVNRDMMSS
ncbi:hypothetical protein MIND_00638600 [Mycena indigotica]|uniref:Uncharacterized protein n=1 Tax=Mycena indigotica TaxID=2126181 RepID=A0A8H6SRB6_9AGAR|nr:uncharacterized protein MIND_00638600 [Mycena indigotica]KAF7304071.1 hypothetical protein MIND_00638600 [Mycena indigotica]